MRFYVLSATSRVCPVCLYHHGCSFERVVILFPFIPENPNVTFCMGCMVVYAVLGWKWCTTYTTRHPFFP